MEFPFNRDVFYPVGQLRDFEVELASRRAADKHFSDNLRSNKLPWAKLRNEELMPFALVLNWRKIPSAAEFKIARESAGGPDLYLRNNNVETNFQLTIADRKYNNDGGRNYALQNAALARDGIAWGAGGTSKNGHRGELQSEPKSTDKIDREIACKEGLFSALKNKLSRPMNSDILIVYARDFAFELIDIGFESFLRSHAEAWIAENAPNQEIDVIIADSGSNPAKSIFSLSNRLRF